MKLSKERWNYLKTLQASPGTVVFKNGTYNIGRNVLKKEARARGSRHIGKAKRLSV